MAEPVVYIPEPQVPDLRMPRWAEHPLDYYRRSTQPGAREVRRFLGRTGIRLNRVRGIAARAPFTTHCPKCHRRRRVEPPVGCRLAESDPDTDDLPGRRPYPWSK